MAVPAVRGRAAHQREPGWGRRSPAKPARSRPPRAPAWSDQRSVPFVRIRTSPLSVRISPAPDRCGPGRFFKRSLRRFFFVYKRTTGVVVCFFGSFKKVSSSFLMIVVCLLFNCRHVLLRMSSPLVEIVVCHFPNCRHSFLRTQLYQMQESTNPKSWGNLTAWHRLVLEGSM